MKQTRNNFRQRHERGIQLIEVILVMPLLLLLIAATAEFGRYFYTYSALARATEVSARYLSGRLLNDDSPDFNITKAINLAVCGQATTVACNANAAVVPGLSASNINWAKAGGTNLFPNTVTVSIVNYNYQSVFNLGNWIGGSWTSIAVTPSTTMRYLLDN